MVLAAAWVVSKLDAGAALAGGMPVETVLDDVAEVVRDTGQDHVEVLRTIGLPVVGSA